MQNKYLICSNRLKFKYLEKYKFIIYKIRLEIYDWTIAFNMYVKPDICTMTFMKCLCIVNGDID